MSDVMLFGVLRMPYEMAMADDLSRYQFWQRVQEAADRLEAAERTTPPSTSTAETAACEAIAKWNSLPDAKLVYDARAQTAACGGTGPKSYALPPSTASEVNEREAIEAAAKAIYRLFEGAEAHPWVERGNSLMQGEARRYARAALASKPVAREASYGPVHVVGDLVRNLLTLDQSAPIYSAFHVDYQGERRCRTRPVSTSWERVIDGKWVDPSRKDVPYAVIVWAKPDERPVEVDVEAERKLYLKEFPSYLGFGWTGRQQDEFKVWLAARRTQEGAKDAERFRQAIACEDSAEVLYGAVLSHAPNGKAIRNEFDAAIAATQTKESQE